MRALPPPLSLFLLLIIIHGNSSYACWGLIIKRHMKFKYFLFLKYVSQNSQQAREEKLPTKGPFIFKYGPEEITPYN